MWYYYDEDVIKIDDFYAWIENFVEVALTHEIIHGVLAKLEELTTANDFDKIFGLKDNSVLLIPSDNIKDTFHRVLKERAEMDWEKNKQR